MRAVAGSIASIFVLTIVLYVCDDPPSEVVGMWMERSHEACTVDDIERLRHSAIVYTWVNGTEPCFNKRRKDAGLSAGGSSLDKEIGELRYSLRSLLHFAPWLDVGVG